MDSNLGVLLLHEKIIKSTLRWIQPHVLPYQSCSQSLILYRDVFLSTTSLFLYACIDDSENRLLPNNVMMIRSYGEENEGLKERRGCAIV
jgi:hypothetical protein